MSDSLTEAQFNRLSRTVLSNPSASVRKEALLEIRKLDHAGMGELYQQVIANDQDDEVRDLAQNLLNKYEIQQALKRGSFETPASVPVPEPERQPEAEPDWLRDQYQPKTTTIGELLEKPSGPAWTCRFCGTENTGGSKCASCGAERSSEQAIAEAPRKRKSRDNAPADVSDVFLLQPSSMAYLLGQKKTMTTLNGLGAGCSSLFMLPFLIVGILVIAFAAVEWRNYHLLETTGEIVRGRYSNKYITTDDDDGGTNYHVEYTYEVNGGLFSGSDTTSWEDYNRAGIGEGINILYAPSDPSLSAIEGMNDIGTPIFLTVFSLIWNLFSWGIFAGIIISLIRDRQLMRDGQTVRGELLSIRGYNGSKGKYYVNAEYTFLPPDSDELLTGKNRVQRSDLRGASLPGKGTPVMVMYKNRRHFKML